MNELADNNFLKKGNREVIVDRYIADEVEDESLKYKVFCRLNAKKQSFKNVSFAHCIFEDCYINSCTFDTCDFTGCKFLGSNFHQSSFRGCDFRYATFERCQIDDDILESEAPIEDNLRMHFARSLRVNYQARGEAKPANKAIKVELEATAKYLYKSCWSKETYYKEKYGGIQAKATQLLRWMEFLALDFVWGNGESVWKFIRTIVIFWALIALMDTWHNGDRLNLSHYVDSFMTAPSVFFGASIPEHYSTAALSWIAGARYISIALLTTLLVRRLNRR